MAGRRRVFRNDASLIDAEVLLDGELVFDTTNKNFRLGDGTTLGGVPIVGGGGGIASSLDDLTDDRAALKPFWNAAADNDPNAMVIRHGGDSTINQENQYPDFMGEALVPQGFTFEKSGASGKNTNDWRTTYLPGDIAAARKLFIWGYGMNDPLGGRTVQQFEDDLDAGLTQYRASLPATTHSVVLLAPNMARDDAQGRTLEALKALDVAIRRQAKKHKCAYLNRFLLYPVDGDTTGALDAAKVHPEPSYAKTIGDAAAAFVSPVPLAAGSGTPLTTGTKSGADAPSTFTKDSIEVSRATVSVPHDGFLVTITPNSSAGFFGFQFNYGYTSGDQGMSFRSGTVGDMWERWVEAGITWLPTAKSPTDPLSEYPFGITAMRATGAGFPVDGVIFTLHIPHPTNANLGWQVCGPIGADANTRGFERWAQGSAWTDFAVFGGSGGGGGGGATVSEAPMTPGTGYQLFSGENATAFKSGGVVGSVGGLGPTGSPATVAQGQAVAVAPAGYRPTLANHGVDLAIFNSSQTVKFEHVPASIATDGTITAQRASTYTAERIYIYLSPYSAA